MQKTGKNVSYNLRETGYESLEWISLDQDRRQWRSVVNRKINLRCPYKAENDGNAL
jgi:hypothetical protein